MAKEVGQTPMMKQFYEMKAKHPDALLLYRVGDFYETPSLQARYWASPSLAAPMELEARTWRWQDFHITPSTPTCQN